MSVTHKVKTHVKNTFEQLKEESVNTAKSVVNEVKNEVFKQITGQESTSSPEQGKNNFTPFDAGTRAELQKAYQEQDQQKIDAIRSQLAEKSQSPEQSAQRQFNYLQDEVKRARAELDQEEHERLEKEKQEAEEERRQAQASQNSAPIEEPGSKQKRGMLFGGKKKKKPQVTVENKPAQGKQ